MTDRDTASANFDADSGVLAVRYLDGSATAEEVERLNAQLAAEPVLCEWFATLCVVVAGLDKVLALPPLQREDGKSPEVQIPPSAGHSPFLTFFGNAYHGTIGFFSQEYPRALLIATVLTGLGLWIGSLIMVTHHVQIAEESSPHVERSVASTREPEPKIEYVGKITGMVDCKWEAKGLGIRDWGLEKAENHQSEIINHKSSNPQSLVSLGDKFALASGLMEITYDTGAKVILQGPVTYEVESKAGGFLSIGKLTGKLEKKGSGVRGQGSETANLPSPAGGGHHEAVEVGGEGSPHNGDRDQPQHALTLALSQGERGPDSNPQSPIPNPFVIRTPTATVTDLGTEFGVEVDDQKVCHVETFVGLVNVSPVAGGESKNGRTLAAGESVRIDAAGVMANTQTKSTDFVRNIVRQAPDAYSKLVLEDRPLTYWPLDESPNADWLIDRLDRNRIGHLIRGVRLGQKGPFANGRSRAAEFTGNDYIQTDSLPESNSTKGFSVEIWTRVDGGNGTFRSPITYCDERGVADRTGFALCAAVDGRWTFPTGTGEFWASVAGPPVVLGQWVYIVGTFTPTGKISDSAFMGIQKLYLNGHLVAKGKQPWKPHDAMSARIGAGITKSPMGDSFFIGGIAEVAIYDRPLGEDRIKAHWEAGKPSNTAVGPPGKEVPSMK